MQWQRLATRGVCPSAVLQPGSCAAMSQLSAIASQEKSNARMQTAKREAAAGGTPLCQCAAIQPDCVLIPEGTHHTCDQLMLQ